MTTYCNVMKNGHEDDFSPTGILIAFFFQVVFLDPSQNSVIVLVFQHSD